MFRCKGRVALPNRMSFRKSAKGGQGVIFNPKIDIADFGNFKQVFLIMKLYTAARLGKHAPHGQ